MEKTVPNKHSRRHSTGNLMFEITGYEDVSSRYLSPPFPSCHDNCKAHPPGFDHPTPPKPTRKRSNRSNSDSLPGTKKPFTPIPKSPTRHANITNTSLAKHQVKSQPVESKGHDIRLKSRSRSRSKSTSEETDPFYIPPSRITRRYSDVNLQINDSPAVGGLVSSAKKYDKKSDSRKDVKPVKGTAKTAEVGVDAKKLQTLKTLNGSKKPGVEHGSQNSKVQSADLVGEVVQENNNKSQCQNEERVLQNGAQTACRSEKDETKRSESRINGSVAASGVKKTENSTRVRKMVKESEELSSKTLKFKQGKIIASQSENNGPKRNKFEKGKVLGENQIGKEDGRSLRRLSCDGVIPTTESNTVNVALKPCEMEVEKFNTPLNNVIEETASRLIQTRKSKVQALVGAFEMISANEL